MDSIQGAGEDIAVHVEPKPVGQAWINFRKEAPIADFAPTDDVELR